MIYRALWDRGHELRGHEDQSVHESRSAECTDIPGDYRSLLDIGKVTQIINQPTLEICNWALRVWNFSIISYVLTNSRQFDSPYTMEFHFAQYSEFPPMLQNAH